MMVDDDHSNYGGIHRCVPALCTRMVDAALDLIYIYIYILKHE